MATLPRASSARDRQSLTSDGARPHSQVTINHIIVNLGKYACRQAACCSQCLVTHSNCNEFLKAMGKDRAKVFFDINVFSPFLAPRTMQTDRPICVQTKLSKRISWGRAGFEKLGSRSFQKPNALKNTHKSPSPDLTSPHTANSRTEWDGVPTTRRSHLLGGRKAMKIIRNVRKLGTHNNGESDSNTLGRPITGNSFIKLPNLRIRSWTFPPLRKPCFRNEN